MSSRKAYEGRELYEWLLVQIVLWFADSGLSRIRLLSALIWLISAIIRKPAMFAFSCYLKVVTPRPASVLMTLPVMALD